MAGYATFKVNVTQEDIDEADDLYKKFHPYHEGIGDYVQSAKCPIACAVKREHPELKPTVNRISLIVKNGAAARFNLPTEAQRFINQWDSDVELEYFGKSHREAVKPFEFEATEYS